MNWDALAATAELISAMLVVVTLVYLAMQLRENTKMLRTSAADRALAFVLEFTGDMARDKEVSQLLTHGIEDWDSLSESERARLAYVLFRLFKIMENIHYLHTLGNLDEETWLSWKNVCIMYAQGQAGRFYLGVRRHFFSQRFLDMIDSEVSASERIPPTKGLAQKGKE
jgi:hypothetical protein